MGASFLTANQVYAEVWNERVEVEERVGYLVSIRGTTSNRRNPQCPIAVAVRGLSSWCHRQRDQGARRAPEDVDGDMEYPCPFGAAELVVLVLELMGWGQCCLPPQLGKMSATTEDESACSLACPCWHEASA
ncbi:hypothetical protein GUJ93_ZPchr0002g24984 [Zizania palustris]|uniref:Uncharacterized protein n=1 Tax=Zizania palustris TaxID=103762 RepID=A0A8J5VE50_ZIZPA|nr:hypothetical protein GUJ93_ZPchr0002g24984 [Zizania palustris]